MVGLVPLHLARTRKVANGLHFLVGDMGLIGLRLPVLVNEDLTLGKATTPPLAVLLEELEPICVSKCLRKAAAQAPPLGRPLEMLVETGLSSPGKGPGRRCLAMHTPLRLRLVGLESWNIEAPRFHVEIGCGILKHLLVVVSCQNHRLRRQNHGEDARGE